MEMQPGGPLQIDRMFHALGDPTRIAIVERLSKGEARVTELAAPLPISLNAVSKHVKVLERGGLVERRIKGRDHFIALNPTAFDLARDWMSAQERFWRERLENLHDFMADGKDSEAKSD
ncbi:MAG: metalloregulator ArsR/SmtB family transcription factor [Parvularculaceae bacterium]